MADETVAPLKRCTKCGESKPATAEIFYPCRRTKCGLSSCCRDCNKKASSARYLRIKRDPALLEAERERCRRKTRARYAADAERRAGEREIRSRIECAACGKPIIATKHSQKFCQECRPRKYAERKRSWSEANRTALLAGKSAWYAANRESIRVRSKLYRQRNKEKIKAEYASNPKARVSRNMSNNIRYCIGRKKNGARWESLVGYTLSDLTSHLERQFVRGMSWDNYGEWHIDHILPIAGFEFETASDPEFRAAWALSNLRPLWARENQSKSAKRTVLI